MFGQLCYGRRFPHMRELVKKYRAVGKRAVFLLEVPWEELWHKELDEVRQELCISPVERQSPA